MKKWRNPFKNNYVMMVKVLLLVLTVIVIMLLLPRERRYKYDYHVGKPWVYADLIAPFDFVILKPDTVVERERQQVLDGRDYYFRYDSLALESGLLSIKHSIVDEHALTGQNANNYFRRWSRIYSRLMQQGIIERVAESGEQMDVERVMVTGGLKTVAHPTSDFLTIREAAQQLDLLLDSANEADMKYGKRILTENLKHNIIFDKELTNKVLDQQLMMIPIAEGAVQTGEIIIERGELVTAHKQQVLDSFKKSFLDLIDTSSNSVRIFFGQLIIVLMVIVALTLYLYFFNPLVFGENRRLLMLLTILMLMQFILFVVYYFFGSQYLYIVPFCLPVVLVTVLFDTRTAFFTHIASLVISSMIIVNGFEFLFVQMAAGIVAAFALRKLHKRAQMFSMILMVFITYFLADVGLTFIEENPLSSAYDSLIYYGLSAGLLVFCYPLIFLFEKLFATITDLSLIEISDTNSPLLRELSVKAPGTFQHANQVAHLAEEAATAIDANPLLVRAGAWYHDIGKIANPLYFVENQVSGMNPHDELTPEESAEIIIDHVIKGIELARKYYIPEPVIDFIRTHHGTRKTGYFYKKMQQMRNENAFDASVFTYHGPNPFSKETALLMMADAVEAASRSLPDKNEESLSELVDKIINGQLNDRQFDKADITMDDITKIKKIFKKLLTNIYHGRISY